MVVVSGSWMKNTQYVNFAKMNVAKAVLVSRPNSHPFHDRTLTLNEPVKVGRSVARARATNTNAIFDCKVLSRHHALLWYENGKFFLQDTNSSNGTFVNNNRLSTSESSEPHEVSSGDIVQFGVDVLENNRKVTHGCIVATLKLYLPDGKEAKASLSVTEGHRHGMVPLDELYKLSQIIQEATQRELCLETKLTALQHVVDAARRAADDSWQAYVGEERLLSRVAALETQLTQAGKGFTEERIREELKQLQEDRNVYQIAAKEALRKSHVERLEAIAAAAEQERARATAEHEVLLTKENWERAQAELQQIAQKLNEVQKKTEEERDRYEAKIRELREQVEILQTAQKIDSDKTEVGEPLGDLDVDPMDAIIKYERILNDDKAEDDTETNRNDINTNIKNENDVNAEIIITNNEIKDDLTQSSITVLSSSIDTNECLVENKDELTTMKENLSEEPMTDDAESEEQKAIYEIELAVSDAFDACQLDDVDTKTLKYQSQTVLEQKRQIEQLEIQASANKTRIAQLERALLNEKNEKASISEQILSLKDEHTLLERRNTESLSEVKQLRSRVDELEGLRTKATTIECASQVESADIEGTYLKRIASLEEQVVGLEDTLVALKERYVAVSEEKLALGKELIGAHDKYNTLCNRSHNKLFFYVAPLAIMVLYLLISSMFS